MTLIEVKNLTKQYGPVTALKNVSLKLEPNRIYGLLGRNGAGKTTLMNIMTNKLYPTQGEILLDGESVTENDHVLQQICYMMERTLFPESMRVKVAFKWAKTFYESFDMDDAISLAALFELPLKSRIGDLSTGYTSLFKAIIALASNARVVIYDEPVLGLDAYHRDLLYREILKNYMANPKTVVISTHLIEEVAHILEEVVIIRKGQVIVADSTEKLLSSSFTASGKKEQVMQFSEGKTWIHQESMGAYTSVIIQQPLTPDLEEQARKMDVTLTNVDLQKLFIHLTNEHEGDLS